MAVRVTEALAAYVVVQVPRAAAEAGAVTDRARASLMVTRELWYAAAGQIEHRKIDRSAGGGVGRCQRGRFRSQRGRLEGEPEIALRIGRQYSTELVAECS